jgi:hypothetical protein
VKGSTANRDDKGQMIIEVQAQNWETVKVYGHCSWEKEAIVGTKEVRFVYHGIPAQEIRAACVLLRIEREKWPLVTSGIVQIMVPAAKPLLNKG